jgi:RecG-like helicase
MDIRMDLLPKNPQIEPVYFTTSGLTIKNISKYVKSVLEEKFKMQDGIKM